MAGKVVKSSFVLLNKFGASRQVSASKTATSHIRKPLVIIVKLHQNYTFKNSSNPLPPKNLYKIFINTN